MNIFESIIKLLEIFVTWHFLAFIILIVYRKQIANLLARLIKGKVASIFSFEAIPLKQEKTIEKKRILDSKEKLIKYIKDNPEKAFNEYMKTYNAYFFERYFNMIYGTQINLLEYLADKEDKSEKFINLITFYSNFMTKTAPPRVTFDQYLGFLGSCKLIKIVTKDNEKIVEISPNGLNFLIYIKSQYPTMYKQRLF